MPLQVQRKDNSEGMPGGTPNGNGAGQGMPGGAPPNGNGQRQGGPGVWR